MAKTGKSEEGKESKEIGNYANKGLESITYNICKTIFTDEESKILCCDRRE